MYQKQTFGNTSTGFGSFNAGASTSSSFSGFKPTTGTSAFGAPPTFGAASTSQPTTGGGLFGSSNTSGGLFGSTATPAQAPAFGATSGFGGFGSTNTGGGLFGNNQSTGLFGANQNTSAFGAKPAGFGFGSTATTGTTGGLFGSQPSTSTGMFGQQNTSIGGGLFSGSTGAFGQQTAAGTAHVKYSPVVGTDVVMKAGTSQNVNIKHHCITCMKEYEGKSLEELRLEDYTAGRKGAAAGGMFGGFQQQQEAKPLFGATPAFGQPATTSAPSLFGGGSMGNTSGFGQTNTFSFGGAAQTNTNTTGGLFGNKPAFGAAAPTGTGLFANTATTQAPAFGTTNTFGFGANTQQQQSGGLFGAKPATTGFGAPATSGFGSFQGGGLFGMKSTAAPTFGAAAPAFGTTAGAFGTNTSTSGGLFGNNTFGKPATTQPTFGFGNTQPTLGTGLGMGLNNSFQAKPAAPAFGNLGTGTSMFQQPAQNTFKTGLDSGLGGGGMFGNTSTLGGNTFGLGMNNTNTSMLGGGVGASAGGNVHEQILTLAARPYGDSPLFKDLLPDSSANADEALKPTNPAAVRAVLDSSAYRLSPASPRVHVTPRAALTDRKSLFDGLEESDASLEDKLSLKPSRKRLVLRPKNSNDDVNDSVDQTDNRSLEEPSRPNTDNAPVPREQPAVRRIEEFVTSTERKSLEENNNHNVETNGDKNGSWLGSGKLPWNDKEKSLDNDTPRLYPSLEREMRGECEQTSERRASWLTTKPLRKPLSSNPELAENSVRELGVRADRSSVDKENNDSLSVSEDEHVPCRDAPPHPAGVKLTRPGYYTIPSLDEMITYMRADGTCVVPHLTVGRRNYGNVFYDCEIDVANMDLDALVHFLNKEVIVYPEDSDKPPVGSGLNRRAVVTLDRVWPRDKTLRRPITDPDRLLKMDYEGKLRRVCDKYDTKFIEYRPQTGSWVFRVEHFSKYGLTDSDEEDEPAPDVLKRQLADQQLQQSAAPAKPQPMAGLGGLGSPGLAVGLLSGQGLAGPPISSPGLMGPGLAGLSGVGLMGSGLAGSGLSGPGLSGLGFNSSGGLLSSEDLYAMQQTSLNLLNGSSKAFDMDVTEDQTEAPSLYSDNRAYGVKSPTSELARLEHRHSHDVQLMKASLYADTEMEDDVSISTGDQQVPQTAVTSLLSLPPPREAVSVVETMHEDAPQVTEEVIMRPLVVHPHTVVLKYHKKVPPFKETIAGRLGAAHIADMGVCRARHTRVGFGPASTLVYPTSFDSVSQLPTSAALSALGHYVRGRGADDWSEPVLARLAIARPSSQHAQDTLARQLECLLEYSEIKSTELQSGEICPQLVVKESAKDRLGLLRALLGVAAKATEYTPDFGVSSAYCLQVWKLCDALWGADLENDGVPGTDDQSIVHRHERLLRWMRECVAEVTDKELAETNRPEPEDESDSHSSKVWSLLIGGRVLEACKLAREKGDLNMAVLLAQATGDPGFQSLLSRQFRVWRDSGAAAHVCAARLACLQLAVAERPPALAPLDWPRALHATARYLCPQVPSLEQVVRTYEGYFADGDEEVDLAALPEQEMGMQFPLPPYAKQFVTETDDGAKRRVLDLRYSLIRARALHARPRVRPAAYTPDPTDYSLSFLLEAWFGTASAHAVVGAAQQLEAQGDWHRAAQALAYHPDTAARCYLIREVLSRHAPARAESPELRARLELVRRLRVPEKWLLLAQAHRAKYEHQQTLEVQYLVGAEQWNAAHRVLIEDLLPEAVLSDNLQSLKDILEKMHAASERHEVSGWECGGKALYHYLRVCDEIRSLVVDADEGGERADVPRRLEALRPELTAACHALRRLKVTGVRGLAARAEMGTRLVQLALAGGESARRLPALLQALRLPPDCAARALHQITSDLAEQASELCVDSTPSSPTSHMVES
ncbi:nuclear pore complex protein Nup98-Nup96 isoform X2 [Aricia agestis]|uniref:nuclear pore complex protein Nup98-Nup96 isoform X2 n=1 Tax=Aricia agestis TaxID=91739 RepID=UPI001C20725E|nr:nuclear pore complex protein Nup98-Nup96 isoform X2 [Aricia agestis]